MISTKISTVISTTIAGEESSRKKRAFRILSETLQNLQITQVASASMLLKTETSPPDFLICTSFDPELTSIIPTLREQNPDHALTIVLFDDTACTPSSISDASSKSNISEETNASEESNTAESSNAIENPNTAGSPNTPGITDLPNKPYTPGMSDPVPTTGDADVSTRLQTISLLFDYWIVTPVESDRDLANQFQLAVFLCEKKRKQFREKVHRKEVESQIQSVLNSIVDAIITIDRRGRIRSFNTTAESLFEYAAAEVIGKNVSVLMPEPYMSEHDDYMHHYHRTGERRIIGIGREVKGRKQSGAVFPMYLAVSESVMGGEVIYTGIVRDLSEQRRLEREVLRISEYERVRIGQDLHDGLGQMLTGIGLISKNLERELLKECGDGGAREGSGSSGFAEGLGGGTVEAEGAGVESAPSERFARLHASAVEITGLIKEADEFARNLARGLVPVDFDKKGLENALVRLAENAEKLFNIRCETRVTGQSEFEDNSQAIHFYRIAQESVSNAVKHGAAGTVQISLAGGPDRIRLRISDDGSGFREDWHAKEGLGVRIMQFRARLSEAELEISSEPGEGTTITCTLNKS